MKKILTLISIAALAAGCEANFVPEQHSTAVVSPSDVVITTSAVGDNSFTFTMSTEGEAAYFSYLVDKSETSVAESLDPETLYSVGYESVAQGTVKWTAEKPAATVTVGDLEPYSTYQIYAVVGSVEGVPGSIAVASVSTSDKAAPEFVESACEENTVAAAFSESIVLSSADSKTVTVKYYARNSEEILAGTEMGTVDGTVTAVQDNIAMINFEGVPAGAFYTVDIPAGMFKDAAGNTTAAVTSALQLVYDPSAGFSIESEGISGQMAPAAFTLGAFEQDVVSDWETPIMVDWGSDYPYGYIDETNGTAVYASSGKTVTYTLASNNDFRYLEGYGVVISLPEEPSRGDVVTLTIPAETFEDLYGNTNAEWTAEFVYAYGYSLDDVLGTYSLSGTSAFGEDPLTGTMSIEESDDDTKGNVMITSFAGLECTPPIYGTFNGDNGVLSLSPAQKFYEAEVNVSETETMSVDLRLLIGIPQGSSLSYSRTLPVEFNMPQSGSLVNVTDYIGILMSMGPDEEFQPIKWAYAYYNVFAEKSLVSGSTSIQPAEARPVFSVKTPSVK